MNIQEDYVSFETAKLLKEKGFDTPVWTRYENEDDNKVIFGDKYNWNNSPMGQISAPTLQMAMKWLREKHIVIIPEVETFYADGSVSLWEYHIWCNDNYEEEQNSFSSYEEACEAAIKYCLEFE